MKVSIMKPVENVHMFLNSKKITMDTSQRRYKTTVITAVTMKVATQTLALVMEEISQATKVSIIRAMPLSFPFWAW